mmetsp:Transcript_23802/g.46634  ORF Transcript_23802/g.46634 Transcript_23802/m.46634 type:complete len:370 (+) Transcript_23802:141-1250(+)
MQRAPRRALLPPAVAAGTCLFLILLYVYPSHDGLSSALRPAASSFLRRLGQTGSSKSLPPVRHVASCRVQSTATTRAATFPRRTENVEGDFFVDSSCIDCDTCRWMAPGVFSRIGDMSAVHKQPETEEQRIEALKALLSCPTASIRTESTPKDIKKAHEALPDPIDATEGVYHCGYHTEKSFAATSYFIRRPQGNVLVDSPRFTPPLVKRLEALGGVKYMFLSHIDDVGDHEKFAKYFNCERVMHAGDFRGALGDAIERPIEGEDDYALAQDLKIIPVPGHTVGSSALLYKDKFLFSGDHLALPRANDYEHLGSFPSFCFHSWEKQIESVEKLRGYSFEWVLPGHGRRFHKAQGMDAELQKAVAWMKTQ